MMKNNPWFRLSVVWLSVSLFTAFSLFTMKDAQSLKKDDHAHNAEERALESMLKSENERNTENKGGVIVLKSSFGGMTYGNTDMPENVQTVPETEAAALPVTKLSEPEPSGSKSSEPEIWKHESAEPEIIEPETFGSETEMSSAVLLRTATEMSDETKSENKDDAETKPENKDDAEKKNKEETAAEKAEETEKAETEAFICTFNSSINRSGKWNAGEDDLFTLEVYGTGTDSAFSMEYFSYDTQKIDALYENYPEPDPQHAEELSEKFGENRGIVSYRCTDGNELSYINIMPGDRIIAVEGNEDAGMRFYTGDGYNKEILEHYEKAVSELRSDGDELVLE